MLLTLAIWLQLADPRESGIDGFAFLDRLAALHDAPPVQDMGRLPPERYCDAQASFARLHSHWLDSRVEMEPHLYGSWHREHARHWTYWHAASAAWCDIGVPARRANLKVMRRLVGRQAWDACEWPAAAPLWRFVEE